MYHIKSDKRARCSSDMICSAMLQTLGEKPFEEISVSDIQRCSTVSRSTFYRHFDSLEDVLALLCDRGFQEILSSGGDSVPAPAAMLHYWYTHGELLDAVVKAGKTELFRDSFSRSLAATRAAELLDADSPEFDYFTSSIAYTMIGTLATWIRRGRRESEEQLMQALLKAFSAMDMLNIFLLN